MLTGPGDSVSLPGIRQADHAWCEAQLCLASNQVLVASGEGRVGHVPLIGRGGSVPDQGGSYEDQRADAGCLLVSKHNMFVVQTHNTL